jgi:intracellular multiplication protein IcmP
MSNKQNEPDAMWTMFWLAIVLTLGAVIFWHYFKGPILEVLRWLRFAELWIVSLFTDRNDACLDWLRNARLNDTSPSDNMIAWTNQCFGSDYLGQLPAQDQNSYFMLSGPAMSGIEQIAAKYYRWPVVAGFVGAAVYVIYFSPRNKFRTRHNLESCIKTQVKMWPVISPIVNFNPIKSSARTPGSMVPDKLPLFAEALAPEEWISFHRIPVTNGIAERETTRRAFLLQLGPRWNGIEGQPPHIRGLFAAFALKGVQRREESDDLLGRLSLGWSPKGGFTITSDIKAEVDKLIRDPEIGGKALEAATSFAWRATALLGVLQWARAMGGVLAPAQFLWLRGTDRPLWYALNNLGRRSFHTEGAGAMAHFMAEQNAKKPLPIPRIDTAIVTLNQYLAESGQPIPPREGNQKTENSNQ